MRDVQAVAKSIKALLRGTKYSIDYYQREYRWQTKQVQELLQDLSASFQEDYRPEHERRDVRNYGQYFLGSIILSDKNNQSYIVDGQQRLTTLTLMLIYLNHLQAARDARVSVDDLIYSEAFGDQSFNIDVDERAPALRSLFRGESIDPTDQPESVRNIVGRYEDIVNLFPDSLEADALPYFIDWLIEKVQVVEIRAFSDEDAYMIFETMNDRGLSLTPLEMLKGYLLANITDQTDRNAASETWQARVEQLGRLGKEEDADSVKSWLRARHAQTIRERRRGAKPQDFDRIGTEFHRWVRDKEQDLGLLRSTDFARFIQRDTSFYTGQYLRMREAARTFSLELEHVFYNAQLGFTLQFPFLLAPMVPEDDERTMTQKARIVSMYLEMLLVRRLWNWKAIDYNTLQYRIYTDIKEARDKDPQQLAAWLRERLERDPDALTFAGNDRFSLHMRNRHAVHRILARITDHIERESGGLPRYTEYIAKSRDPYEVEHIWANKYEEHGHTEEFGHVQDFLDYRNRIGGLLLLRKSFNASYGALRYEDKLECYRSHSHNLLASSLHPAVYERNPGFNRYIERGGLPFRAHPHFRRADLEERYRLYTRIAEEIWNPERLTREAIG